MPEYSFYNISQNSDNVISDQLLNRKFDNEPITLCFPKPVYRIEFSPYEWSHEIFIVCFETKIEVFIIKFKEEYDELEQSVSLKKLKIAEHDSIVRALNLSPKASLKESPSNITFAVADLNSKIVIFTSISMNEFTKKIIFQSDDTTKFINDVAYDNSGQFLAAAGDNLTCRIWSVEEDYELFNIFYLSSPGMSLKWHNFEKGKLLVGEQKGTVRIYSVFRKTAIISIDVTNLGPLSLIDWSPNSSDIIAVASGPHLSVWNVSSPSAPIYSARIHREIIRQMCFARMSEKKIFSLGDPGYSFKLTSLNKQLPIEFGELQVATNIINYSTLPYVAVGTDNKVKLWKIIN